MVDIVLDIPDADLPSVPWPSSHTDPGTYVDASLGSIPIKMASTSGYATTMADGAIAWRSKTQPITAQNVSEAELITGNAAGKVIKYIRMVSTDLGFPPNEPSPIWKDNKSVLKIVNHDRPTPRSHHIAICYFGLQQWCELGELVLIHISGKVNPSDALTKAMGWMLHYHHCGSSRDIIVFVPTHPPSAPLHLQLFSQLGRESADLRADTGLRNQDPSALTLRISTGLRTYVLTHMEHSDSSLFERSV